MLRKARHLPWKPRKGCYGKWGVKRFHALAYVSARSMASPHAGKTVVGSLWLPKSMSAPFLPF
jgi:hypothetical protein